MRLALALALVTACSYDRPARLDGDGSVIPGACFDNNGGCDVNATCASPQGTAVCTCKRGFAGNGRTCQPVWERKFTIQGIKLDDGFGASVVALGTKIYFAPDSGNAGLYFKSIDTQNGSVADHPMPPLYNTTQNEFCACGIDQVMAALQGEVFLFGNSGASYVETTQAWTDRSAQYPQSEQRYDATAVTAIGRIYVLGGADTFATSVSYYVPTVGFTADPTPLPFDLRSGGAVAVGTTIYVFGGVQTARNKTAKRDVASASPWQVLADSPSALSSPTGAVFNGSIIVVGARATMAMVYEPSSNTWKTDIPLPTGLDHPYIVQIGTDVYVVGQVAGPHVEIHKLTALP